VDIIRFLTTPEEYCRGLPTEAIAHRERHHGRISHALSVLRSTEGDTAGAAFKYRWQSGLDLHVMSSANGG